MPSQQIIVFDFETYWSKDYTLSRIPPVLYVRDERFYAQCLGVSVNFQKPVVYEHDEIPDVLAGFPEDALLIGHNSAGFDNLILSEVYNYHPRRMTDTMHLMRWTGVSRLINESLSSMTHWFNTGEKRAGTVISLGKRTASDFTPDEWEDFKRYCSEDVEQTAACAKIMLKYITPEALAFSSMACEMATDPVFEIAPHILKIYLEGLDHAEQVAMQDLKRICHLPADISDEELKKHIRSKAKFSQLLTDLGVDVPVKFSPKQTEQARKKLEKRLEAAPQASKDTFAAQLADPDNYAVYTPALSKTDQEFLDLLEYPDPRVRTLVQIRLEHNSSIARSRATNLLALAGKPLPVMLKAFYAHTGRFGAGASEGKSDGTQIQNLPKHNKSMAPLRKAIRAPNGWKVVACDSSQIEARCLAYLAGQEDVIEQFRRGADIYAEFATKLNPSYTAAEIHTGAKQGDAELKNLRQIAKKLILGCGFGTGARKVAEVLWREKTRLDEDRDTHDAIAASYLKLYRAANDKIVAFWRSCQNMLEQLYYFHSGVLTPQVSYGIDKIAGRVECPTVTLTGPKYHMRYPNLQFADGQFTYDRVRLGATRIFGSALTENITQSFAFMILLHQAVQLRRCGIPVAANIHDSFSAVVPAKYADRVAEIMLREMRKAPPWCSDIPLEAEVEIGEDFSIC